MTTAASKVLHLPELLELIFAHLSTIEDLIIRQKTAESRCIVRRPVSLVSAALVNKLWCDEAIKQIWGTKPISLKDLLLITPSRRQYYAKHIRRFQDLIIRDLSHFATTGQLGHLNWPKLEQADVACVIGDAQPFVPGQMPQHKMMMDIDDPSGLAQARKDLDLRKELKTIDSTLPLRCFTLEDRTTARLPSDLDHMAVTNTDIQLFVTRHPTINSITIHSYDGMEDTAFMRYIANRPHLRHLELSFNPFDDEQIRWLSPDSLTSLTSLSFSGNPGTFFAFLPHLTHLTDLSLQITGQLGSTISQNDIDLLFASLASVVPSLTTFRLRALIYGMFDTSQLRIQPSSLLAFARGCPRLEILHFDPSTSPDCSALSDRDIDTLAQTLPRLTSLVLPIKPHLTSDELTIRSLASLATHCPRLRHLHLNAPLDPTDLLVSGTSTSASIVRFPRLQTLILGLPRAGIQPLLARGYLLEDALARCFPMLETVQIPQWLGWAGSSDACRVPRVGRWVVMCVDPVWDGGVRDETKGEGEVGVGCSVRFGRWEMRGGRWG